MSCFQFGAVNTWFNFGSIPVASPRKFSLKNTPERLLSTPLKGRNLRKTQHLILALNIFDVRIFWDHIHWHFYLCYRLGEWASCGFRFHLHISDQSLLGSCRCVFRTVKDYWLQFFFIDGFWLYKVWNHVSRTLWQSLFRNLFWLFLVFCRFWASFGQNFDLRDFGNIQNRNRRMLGLKWLTLIVTLIYTAFLRLVTLIAKSIKLRPRLIKFIKLLNGSCARMPHLWINKWIFTDNLRAIIRQHLRRLRVFHDQAHIERIHLSLLLRKQKLSFCLLPHILRAAEYVFKVEIIAFKALKSI